MDNCPLCGSENPQNIPDSMTAGAILGVYARGMRDKADLLESENRSLIFQVEKLQSELKISADALYSLVAPRVATTDIKQNLQLPEN